VAAATAEVVAVLVVVLVVTGAAVARVPPDDLQGLPAGQQICGLLFQLTH
jgi:hypothetical protein